MSTAGRAAHEGGVPPATVQRSSRDPEVTRRRLESWLADRFPGRRVTVPDLEGTSSNGMSSETLLFDAVVAPAGTGGDGTSGTRHERLVARVAPDPADVPVFPTYDLGSQFAVLREVAAASAVPVPRVRWYEPDPAPLGAPFFVMDRADGRVPPDVLPYNFGDSWLYDASAEHQQRLQRATVDVLGELHAIADPVRRAPYLERSAAGDTHLRRHVRATHEWYRWAAEGGFRSPLVERAFRWLDDHWPADEGEPVLSWGDARIGNIMFGDDFRPVAVLDWELAGLGPRELDVMWLVYGHRVFEDIATSLGLVGMPHLLRPADVATAYEHATGYAPRDQAFYGTYAATQFAIVFVRTGRRQVHFGEIDAPGEPDELIMNRDALEQMLAGAYWH